MSDFDSEKHPRDSHGEFTSGGLSAWAKKRAPDVAGMLLQRAEDRGGFSYRPDQPDPKTGYMVSLPTSAGANHVVDIKEMANREPPPTREEMRAELKKQMASWLKVNRPKLAAMPSDHYLGGWVERHNGEEKGVPVAMHFDISQRMPNRTKAIAAGKERNQKAVWRLDTSEEIPTGGTGT
jgi:hypothetical protein